MHRCFDRRSISICSYSTVCAYTGNSPSIVLYLMEIAMSTFPAPGIRSAVAVSGASAKPVPATASRGAGFAAALSGPIVPTMLRLGLPTLLVLVIQTFVGVAETYFVSYLGTDALAGVTLVFPVLMLVQMMANGGIGGGVSSAVSRALGAGRPSDANAL